MSTVTQFPAYIRAVYQEGDAFTRFQQEVSNATGRAEREFGQLGDQMRKVLDRAVTAPRGAGGALNLGVAEAQAAARAADARAAAALEVANAVRLAAQQEGDYSQQARLSGAAAEALANDELQAARAARDHAAALEQVQAVLDRKAAAMAGATNVTRLHTTATGQQRAAMINASQQLQDITVQFASGQRASTIFAQQLPQLGFALSGLEGSTSKAAARLGALGTFLAGPWGVAVFAGVTALGFLAESLSRTSDRLDETASAAEQSAAKIRTALENLQAYGATASELSGLFTNSSDVRINAARKEAQAGRLELDAQQAREQAGKRGVGIDREFRAAAIRRAEAADTRAAALRREANADRAASDAALKAATQRTKAQGVIEQLNKPATGGGSSSRSGGAGVDKEARATAKELDQLESKIQSLEARFDPATSAAREFADALEAINQAAARGVISPGRAQELSTAALFAERDRSIAANSAEIGKFLQVYQPINLDGLVESADAYIRRVSEGWKDSQKDAAAGFARALQTVDIAKSLTSGRGIANFGRGLAAGQIDLGNSEFTDAFAKAFQTGVKDIEQAFSGALTKVLGPNSSKIGDALGKGFLGAQIGSMTHDLLEGFGVKTSKLGSQIGGAIGSAFGPIGSLIGSAIGGLGVEALKPAKRGSATIGGFGGNLTIASSRGNSKARVGQSVETADEAISTLERIAQALGGRIDAARGSVSIGVRGDSFRVDTSGKGITKTKKGAVDFGEDSAAAIRFATLDLIQDGVVQGIRASTQRVLQSGKDLESAIQRAVDFQSVFDRLQAHIDPVGAAIAGVERGFTRLRDIFGQAQASAEEYADLEKLFAIERADAVKKANEAVLGSMQSLLDDLRFGDNGRSLRDRLAAAQVKFDPLAARVESGDTTAYDDFAEAARALLDIQRQFSGSQTGFFQLQDRITALTAKAVEGGNVTSILAGNAASAQADAQRAYDGSNVVSAIDRQTQQLGDILLRAVGGELRAIRDNTRGGGAANTIPGFFTQNVRQV